MSDKYFFNQNADLGITRWFDYDWETDTFGIHTEQDLEPSIEANKALFNDAPTNWRGDMHLVASIPMSIYFDLKQKGITDDDEAMKRWLNSSENQVFRTRPGAI